MTVAVSLQITGPSHLLKGMIKDDYGAAIMGDLETDLPPEVKLECFSITKL
jgi:hypothetical protein